MIEPRAVEQFRLATEPTSGALARAKVRLQQATERPFRPWRWMFAGLALAATSILSVVILRSQPEPAPVASPALVHADLTPDMAAPISVGAYVRITPHGVGKVSGTERATRIDWGSGRVEVEVTPNQGITLDVMTREAIVSVIGTGFTVDRSALGTTVLVQHGTVRVACTGREEQFLTFGESTECLPTSAAGLLARGRALWAQGSGEEALKSIRAAAAISDEPVTSELRMLEAEITYAQGDADESLRVLDVIVANPASTRYRDALGVSARILNDRYGCERARTRLLELRSIDGAAPELSALASCLTP